MIDVLFVVLAVLLGAGVLYYFVQGQPVTKKKCGSCPHAEKNAVSW